MSVTNSWKHYYLNANGKLRKKSRNFVPKYLKRSMTVPEFSELKGKAWQEEVQSEGRKLFQGWNRSAYFRFRASRDHLNELSSNKSEPESIVKKSSLISPLRPLHRVRKRPKSEIKPMEIISKVKHLINGKIVIVTPNLVVTRTSPTPEDISPSASYKDHLKVLEN